MSDLLPTLVTIQSVLYEVVGHVQVDLVKALRDEVWIIVKHDAAKDITHSFILLEVWLDE